MPPPSSPTIYAFADTALIEIDPCIEESLQHHEFQTG
jgi:hypothetical protein